MKQVQLWVNIPICTRTYSSIIIADIPVQVELRSQIVKLDRAIMMGAPDEAQFIGWIAETINATRVIEVGVFRGSTTLALANLALPTRGRKSCGSGCV